MDDKPLITVITVCYNAISDIEKTILSVIHQLYSNIEYVIIDGGSVDGTVEIIKKYQDKISYWISEADKGIYDAMNKGIDKAAGGWVCFMNAGDTFYSPDTILSVSDCFCHQYDIVYGKVNMVDKSYSKLVTPATVPDKNNPMPFNHQAVFTKTDLLKRMPFNLSYRYAADYDFYNKILPSARYCFCDEIIASYMIDGISSCNGLSVSLEKIKINPCFYNYYYHLLYMRNFLIKRILTLLGLSKAIQILRQYYL
ncbi:glycosyltransferase family 2 protein [Bacteroides fragilis]|jgi:glycosyltransferase involved in cell wall biosynthesis|nr:glycosyltransferase family 2 protein [Bacteroides fragilis]MCE8612383.1 glycosyltransferase [Bacteroides fragilis]MCM0275045.1 glycosyltransferase [Bacteroides fragilis]MCZ2616199.1 glycosyltransferase family 2 protein [Bacteroides fragilis]MCZ2623419.1 glycosyltransferase family 2 protein [Bacteroides fragilis]